MMKLNKLLTEVSLLTPAANNLDVTVERIDFDSRQVQPGSLFVAVRGRAVDGHQFIDAAIHNGAAVVVAETPAPPTLPAQVTWLQVAHTALALGQLAAAFYGHPSRRLTLVGVTGTNGKTTVATLLYQLFTQLGYTCGLLSTVENRIGQQVAPAQYTTPDAVSLNALLAAMLEAGCTHAFMEVSSHAIDQERIAGLAFAGGIFTNMSHDHLDYHGSFAAYIEAKKKFFDQLPATAFALVNVDDKRGEVMVQNTRARIQRYSLRALVDFRIRLLDNSAQGLHLEVNGQEVYARMLGEFNAYNLLAAYGAGVLLGEDPAAVLAILSGLPGAEGRLEPVGMPGQGITAIVDYAHTPDALEKVLTTVRNLRRPGNRLVVVVGCGGDRDRAKRPVMAQLAVKLSDQAILTSDNPRTENPEAILDEMEAGLEGIHATHLRISDRRSAIHTACKLAQPGDIVLVAGKGHEKYQEIQGIRHPFDDKAVLRDALGLTTSHTK